jgi:hypothetical protein
MRYPTTPTLSVLGTHERAASLGSIAVAVRLPGCVGAIESVGVGVGVPGKVILAVAPNGETSTEQQLRRPLTPNKRRPQLAQDRWCRVERPATMRMAAKLLGQCLGEPRTREAAAVVEAVIGRRFPVAYSVIAKTAYPFEPSCVEKAPRKMRRSALVRLGDQADARRAESLINPGRALGA